MSFYEVRARSIISRVPRQPAMPFRATINPYRGCGHACVYCFARGIHAYLGMDGGVDFDTRIVVKVNAPELLARELATPRGTGEHIAMGTNVNCYQSAEGRNRLMPGIIAALRDARNPSSIPTKGTLILRDLDLLAGASEVTPWAWRSRWDSPTGACPGWPSPARRTRTGDWRSARRSRAADCAAGC